MIYKHGKFNSPMITDIYFNCYSIDNALISVALKMFDAHVRCFWPEFRTQLIALIFFIISYKKLKISFKMFYEILSISTWDLMTEPTKTNPMENQDKPLSRQIL